MDDTVVLPHSVSEQNGSINNFGNLKLTVNLLEDTPARFVGQNHISMGVNDTFIEGEDCEAADRARFEFLVW